MESSLGDGDDFGANAIAREESDGVFVGGGAADAGESRACEGEIGLARIQGIELQL